MLDSCLASSVYLRNFECGLSSAVSPLKVVVVEEVGVSSQFEMDGFLTVDTGTVVVNNGGVVNVPLDVVTSVDSVD